MTAQPDSIDLTRRESFQLFTPVTIRFSDTDRLGHVNNVAIASYFEAGRCELFYALLKQAGAPNLDFVLAHLAIDFRQEIHYPGTVEIGSALIGIGTKSLRTGYGAFVGSRCIATANCINVFFDLETRRSQAPSPEMRRLLEAMLAPAAEN